jgi:hypothetical protein
VDSDDFAAYVAHCLDQGPLGTRPDYAGTQALALNEIARSYLTARQLHRRILHLPMPPGLTRALGALPGPDARPGHAHLARMARQTPRPLMADAHSPGRLEVELLCGRRSLGTCQRTSSERRHRAEQGDRRRDGVRVGGQARPGGSTGVCLDRRSLIMGRLLAETSPQASGTPKRSAPGCPRRLEAWPASSSGGASFTRHCAGRSRRSWRRRRPQRLGVRRRAAREPAGAA